MKPDYLLTQEQMENFSIPAIKNLEGCPQALSFLIRRFGKESYDIKLHKSAFIQLIREEKTSWVINFILNLLAPHSRLRFLINSISDNLYLISDQSIQDSIVDLFRLKMSNPDDPQVNNLTSKITTYRIKVKSQLKEISDDMLKVSQFKDLYAQSQFLKAILFLSDSNYTMSATQYAQHLAEAISIKYEDLNEVNLIQSTLDNIAYSLLDYSQIFVVTEEKEI